MSQKSEAQESTTLMAILVGAGFVVLGIACLWISAYTEENHYLKTASVLREMGAFALIGSALGLWWEIVGKRKYTDELFAKIGMARHLVSAGVGTITMSFNDDQIDWTNLFGQSSTLDIWVAYANTWRNKNIDKIRALLARNDSKIRIILPDPDDENLMAQLAARFSKDADGLRDNILETVNEFRALAVEPAKLEIHFAPKSPLFTFYVFNNFAVLAFYNHRDGKLSVPTFVCNHEGTLYQYLSNEFAGLRVGARLAE
jgi:hypothetical protein